MARPKKEYCDYFSHDRDMRNHRKIKALRLKYGIQGYAIWVMFLEFLTGNDNNIFINTDIELELLSGDFGVSVNEISDILNYCIKMNLLIEKDGNIYSDSLNERLEYVYNKRKNKKLLSNEQERDNGKYKSKDKNILVSVTESTHEDSVAAVSVTESTHEDSVAAVSVTEIPQSKVNKSKVNKSNKENNTFKDTEDNKHNKNLESNSTQESLLKNSNLFRKPNIPTFEQVHEEFIRKGGTKEMAEKFFEINSGLDWYYKNSPIINFSNFVSGYISSWKNNEDKSQKVPKNTYIVQTPREDW